MVLLLIASTPLFEMPPPDTLPRKFALFLLTVLLLIVSIPRLSTPPLSLALFPLMVLLLIVAVAKPSGRATGEGAISTDRAVVDHHRATLAEDAAAFGRALILALYECLIRADRAVVDR